MTVNLSRGHPFNHSNITMQLVTLYASVRLHIEYALFLLLFRGIKALIDLRNLRAPSAPAHMIQGQDFIFTPMEVVRDERHFPVQLILRIKPQPSPVKFSGTSKVLPQSGHTAVITGGSISFILWYIS